MTFYVDRTPGGGYQVSKDPSTAIAGAVGSGIGAILGGSISMTVGAVRRYSYSRAEQSLAVIQAASEANDCDTAHSLAREFVRKPPDITAGFEALTDTATNAPSLSPADRLAIAQTAELHGVAMGAVAALRFVAHFDADDLSAALRDANDLAALGGEDGVLGRLLRVKVLLAAGDLDLALDNATAALGMMPSELTYSVRGEARRACGDVDGAITDLSIALRLDPRSADLLEQRAALYEEKGRSDDAEADRRASAEVHAAAEATRAATVAAAARSKKTEGPFGSGWSGSLMGDRG